MQTLPGFFQGLIAQDFQEVLAAAPAEHGEKPASGYAACKPKEKPSSSEDCPPPDTQGPGCTVPNICKTKKKADAFVPQVTGWSSPPAPPAF